MALALIIGGKGKVGSYLAPLLGAEGFELINVSRGKTGPVLADPVWEKVRQINLDRGGPGFAERIAELKPDIVLDMICFETADMLALVEALRGRVSHYLVTGSMWMHGPGTELPVAEDEDREPLEHYGKEKSGMDRAIAREFRAGGFPGTIVHPGHIVCPADIPINPQGCKSLEAFRILKNGEPLWLPNFGMETLHHVHAADVAGVFMAAVKAGKAAYGEGFHAVSPRALSLRGYAAAAAAWYGRKAELRFEPYDAWKNRVSPGDGEATLTHILHSPSGSMEKAKRLLGFSPAYTSLEAVRECLGSFNLDV
ncbi:MAG: NAD-dependent epimerase/dehydratase family protein [Treponema sp.]|jgi:nucleoside-diphosphate-sugar epimerase|nr:NAD-dependent epimerase/dehydratase family protein [Treponema sp.]